MGTYRLRIIIKGISDYGQVFVISSKNNLDDTIVKLIKNRKNICYITLEKSVKDINVIFDTYFIDKSSFIFIDGSKNQGSFNNCINIENNPESIKTNLEKILKEKKIDCVFFDDVSSVKKIEEYNISRFIQDLSLLIKSNESVGFFIGKIENLKKETINDVMMFVDKVIGDGK